MYKTTGTIDKNFYNKIKAYILPTKNKFVYFIFVTFLTLFFLMACIAKDYLIAEVIGFLIVYFTLICFFIINKNIKITLKRTIESTGSSSVDCTVYFDDDGVHIENHQLGSKATIKYNSFVKLVKCGSYYILFTKTNQFVPIFTSCLSDDQKEGLLVYLKNFIPN